MPFFRTVAGLRVSLVVWATLLVVIGVLWVVDPGDWGRHLEVAVVPAFGLVTTLLRLRRVRVRVRATEPQHTA
jgi:hypothetical protein